MIADSAVEVRRAELEKKIATINQYQGLCFIPIITGVLLPSMRHEAIPPERRHIVALFRLGVFVVSWGAWGYMQWRKKKLKAELDSLSMGETAISGPARPPIAPPE